jgi:hypothetical protein
MPPSDVAADLAAGERHAPDPELEALPEPRRPWRRVTLLTLSVTAIASLLMIWALRGEAGYALRGGTPDQVGELSRFQPRAELQNAWIHGAAELAPHPAVRYSRPLESDSYRLAQIAGNPRLWVQIRVPSELEGPHFVPPTSFVGRLVSFSSAGLRHAGLADAVEAASQGKVGSGAWLLIDGEAPKTTRWALGLVALFAAFAAFNVYGLYRLTRRADA